MKKALLTLLTLGLSVVLSVAHAGLNLVLTQGVDQAQPIAIPALIGPKTLVSGGISLMQVVRNDLTNSGQFRVIPSANQTQKPLQSVDYNSWRQLGVNTVVLGTVKSILGLYTVHIELIDVYTKTVLLNKTYTVRETQLRQLAHKISDAVYQKLTGVRGIFSTKLAYILVQNHQGVSQYRLEVCDADGFNPRTLLVSPMPLMSPAWSPDGSQIAYVSFEHHRAAIYSQDVASGQRIKISDAPGINGAPAFAPDGTKMALVLTRTGYPKIYIKNLISGKLKQLTKGWSIDTEPNFAPDGKSLLFTSNRGGTPQIYRYNLQTAKVDRVTFSGNYNARARFFPSQKAIVMLHRESGLFGIATQNLATGRVEVLTRANSDESPSLAPNGRMVIYATQYGGKGVLAMVSTDGRVQLRLPARDGNVQEPAWSPFRR